MTDVVLTAALRSNLLNLQETQSLIDVTQNRLATGRKVSSALDNPQSYFAAKSLSDRASDLTSLLDGIGQSISTIKAADEGITSLEGLIDQADSLVDEARSTSAAGGKASITGNIALDGSKNFDSYSNVTANDIITFDLTDGDGKDVTFDTNSGDGTGTSGGNMQITIQANETVDEVIAQINAIEDSSNNAVLKASLTEDGFLKIESLAGGDMRIEFSTTTLDDGLGFGAIGAKEMSNVSDASAYTPDDAAITVSRTAAIESYKLYDSNGDVATRTTDIDDLFYKAPGTGTLTAVDTNGLDASDDFLVGVNGDTMTASNKVLLNNLDTATVQDLIDGINTNSLLKDTIEASFDESNGQISIRAKSADAKSVQFGIEANANQAGIDLGFGMTGVDATGTANNTFQDTESVAFGNGAGQLSQLEKDYDAILTQINDLAGDSGYRGVNLLTGDSMTTYFNEDNSSSLVVNGTDLTTGSNGLNLSAANFGSTASIATATSEISSAQTTVKNFAASLSTSLGILQNRETFTKSMVSTLTEGSDKLTLADQNEEGAKLLSLQTRQTLGVTSLALASQSQQSVLRLF